MCLELASFILLLLILDIKMQSPIPRVKLVMHFKEMLPWSLWTLFFLLLQVVVEHYGLSLQFDIMGSWTSGNYWMLARMGMRLDLLVWSSRVWWPHWLLQVPHRHAIRQHELVHGVTHHTADVNLLWLWLISDWALAARCLKPCEALHFGAQISCLLGLITSEVACEPISTRGVNHMLWVSKFLIRLKEYGMLDFVLFLGVVRAPFSGGQCFTQELFKDVLTLWLALPNHAEHLGKHPTE